MSTWLERYKVHPAADVFPLMVGDELAALAEDIKAHGLRKRIIFLRDGADELLLDGRNRIQAMEMAGIEIDAAKHCQVSESMVDPVAYIISANVQGRRNMKASEALIAWDDERRPQVKVGPLMSSPKGRDWTDPYCYTGGAAYTARRDMKGKAALQAIIFDVRLLTVEYGIDPKDVHDAFMQIDEYREAITKMGPITLWGGAPPR